MSHSFSKQQIDKYKKKNLQKVLLMVQSQNRSDICKQNSDLLVIGLTLTICSSIGKMTVTSNDSDVISQVTSLPNDLTIWSSLLLTSFLLVIFTNRNDVIRSDEQMVSH